MINQKTTIATMSLIAALTIGTIAGFHLNEIDAEETDEKSYRFAEDVKITAQFTFKEGIEVNQFEVYNQKIGFNNGAGDAVFELEKIVGNTPLLHKAADYSHTMNGMREKIEDSLQAFDVDVIISKGPEIMRQFDYDLCAVTDYNISTLFDKEEGWNSDKGFALLDKFEISCDDYKPLNPTYKKMSSQTIKSNGKSSIDYQKEQRDMFGR